MGVGGGGGGGGVGVWVFASCASEASLELLTVYVFQRVGLFTCPAGFALDLITCPLLMQTHPWGQ